MPSSSPTPSKTPTIAPYAIAHCTPHLNGWSVARYWDEQALNLVRVNPPAPTVAARNLFDLSAVMWDAWAAYDPTAVGYFYDANQTADDVAAARDVAISYAAFRLLLQRHFGLRDIAYGMSDIPPEFAQVMSDMCYRPEFNVLSAPSPANVGIHIAAVAIRAGMTDGSLEGMGYVDVSFTPANDPMRPFKPGTVMKDPNLWQPLQFPPGQAQGQGGRPAPDVQAFVAAQWGNVAPFALPKTTDGVAIDPGAAGSTGPRPGPRCRIQACRDRHPALQLDARSG